MSAIDNVQSIAVRNINPTILYCRLYSTVGISGEINPFVLRSATVFGNEPYERRSDAIGPSIVLPEAKSRTLPSVTIVNKPAKKFQLSNLFTSKPQSILWMVVSVNDLSSVNTIINIHKIKGCEWFAYNLTALGEIAKSQSLVNKSVNLEQLTLTIQTPQCTDLIFSTGGSHTLRVGGFFF